MEAPSYGVEDKTGPSCGDKNIVPQHSFSHNYVGLLL